MTRPSRQAPHRTRPRVEVLEAKQLLATFLVTSAADSGPSTLRQAILDADADSKPSLGFNAEVIDFAISGGGVHTIAPAFPLPTLDQPTDVDATTQPGYAGSPLIVLDGSNAVGVGGAPVVGLDITAGNNGPGAAVKGLGIVRFSGTGLQTDTFGTDVIGVVIGTDVAGDQNLGNGGYGIKFGINGGNYVSNSVIENNGLRGIGGALDVPGVPTVQNGIYVSTQGVIEDHNDAQATELVVTTPDRSASGRYAQWGSSLTLTYTITNTGKNAATNVSLALDQNQFFKLLTVTSATTTQGTIGTDPSVDGNDPAFASLGTLAPGASATVTVTVKVGPEDQFPNGIGQLTLLASSPQLDYDPFQTEGNYDIFPNATGQPPASTPPTDTTQLIASTPTGTIDDEYAQWGSTIELSYTISNTGPVAATDVTVAFAQALFSHLLTVTSATTTQGTIGTNLSLSDDHPAFASLGTLAPGASATITLVAQLGLEDPNDAQGDIISATVSSPEQGAPPFQQPTIYTIIPNATGQPPTPTTPTAPPNPSPPIVGMPTPPFTPIGGTTPIPLPVSTPTGGIQPIVTAQPPIVSRPIISAPIIPARADLVVSSTEPVAPRVGAASLFMIGIENAGNATAPDAVASLDLGGLPAGSFYSIMSRESTGGPGTLKPVAGRPGVYRVDLGTMAAGASATVAVMVIPDAAGPIGLSVATSDGASPLASFASVGHTASASSFVAPEVQIADVEMPEAGVMQLYFASAIPKAQAQNLNNYRLTASGTTGTQPTATVRLRSATYNAANHRVTLRLAHPLPVTASGVRLSVSNLGATGYASTTTLSLPRKHPKR